jgi:ferredoxin, 2Fe-2S
MPGVLRMVKLLVTTREGEEKALDATEGANLMNVLRENDLGVPGTCGGMCSCGSCHIFASDALLAAAPPPSEDERDMLDALSDAIEVRPCSRLSCQIAITPALDGASLEIGPQI